MRKPFLVAVLSLLTFFGVALLCFSLAMLVSCALPEVRVDCWQRPKDMPPFTVDVCHGKQLHFVYKF